MAVETLTTTNRVVLAGEINMHDPDIKVENEKFIAKAREAIRDIGYEQEGFHWQNAEIECLIHGQSAHIAQGVDGRDDREEGAGDQGIMFGYAVDETPSLMPAPIALAHDLVKALAKARHDGTRKEFLPDAKSQVSLQYENGKPVGASSIVVSSQHIAGLSQGDMRELVRPFVMDVLPDGWMCPEEEFYVNPTGAFEIGGPDGDAGLTGRKIIVDTYGGAAPHGGGAFSGKDPTKVDRSAAYAARYLAKNVVAAGIAQKCLIQLSYAIGVAKPLSVYVDCSGTAQVDEEKLSAILQEMVDLSPRGIRDHLQLNQPIYERTAAYGHFGREPDADGGFSWEKTDLVNALKSAF